MEQSTSNDVDTNYTEDIKDKPIMHLFKRLINNDFKQTNAQIFELLKKEFKMNTNGMHELEIDIYLNVVKKFLKEWPWWDEFDVCFNNPKHVNNQKHMDKILSQYYVSLKHYINKILTLAKPMVTEALNKVKTQSISDTKTDVVLEVTCSRPQLNQLVLRHPDSSNCIFVNINTVPRNIIIFPLTSILEWFNVTTHIMLKNFRFTYYTDHKLTHMLVNKKSKMEIKQPTALDSELLYTQISKKSKNYHKRNLIGVMKQLLKSHQNCELLATLCKTLEEDLRDVEIMKIPGGYKKHITKYPYKRCLYTELDKAGDQNVDCQLEETIVPIHTFHVTSIITDLQSSSFDWIRVECGYCKVKFPGVTCVDSLKQHFAEYHNSEPDWQCMKCEGRLTMLELTSRRWQHDCVEPSSSSSNK